MPTVLDVDGFRIVIYLPDREHGPAHVHVFRAGAELIVALGAIGEQPTVTRNRGMRDADTVAAYRIIQDHLITLLPGGNTMKKQTVTDTQIIAQGRAASKKEQEDRAAGLRAKAAWYDHASGYLMMMLTNDRLFGVSAHAIPHLKGLKPVQLGTVTLSPSGGGLHWEALDIHIGIPGLLLEALGRQTVVSVWGRTAGSATSAAKAKSSRANGAKGGRPRKKRVA
jgi:hypothetical protein